MNILFALVGIVILLIAGLLINLGIKFDKKSNIATNEIDICAYRDEAAGCAILGILCLFAGAGCILSLAI